MLCLFYTDLLLVLIYFIYLHMNFWTISESFTFQVGTETQFTPTDCFSDAVSPGAAPYPYPETPLAGCVSGSILSHGSRTRCVSESTLAVMQWSARDTDSGFQTLPVTGGLRQGRRAASLRLGNNNHCDLTSRSAARRTRSPRRGFVGVATAGSLRQSDAGCRGANALGAAEYRRRSSGKVMRACRGANALGAAGFRRRSNRKVMRVAAGRTRSALRSSVGVSPADGKSDAGVPRSKMLDAAEVQQRSARTAMLACRGAACSTRPEWSSFSYVNLNLLLRAS